MAKNTPRGPRPASSYIAEIRSLYSVVYPLATVVNVRVFRLGPGGAQADIHGGDRAVVSVGSDEYAAVVALSRKMRRVVEATRDAADCALRAAKRLDKKWVT